MDNKKEDDKALLAGFGQISQSKFIPQNPQKKSALAESMKKDLLANLEGGDKTPRVNDDIPATEKTSTRQKDVFYHSFKNIRDRYQFKEQRINNIQMRNEKILKDLNKKKK